MYTHDHSELVSVIIPTFNRETVLAETLLSVASQSYRPIELVIIDDGSTDGTEDLVAQFTAEWSSEEFSIIYIGQPNMGVSAARNRGLAVITGEFVQYLDSDDLIAADKIQLQVQALTRDPSAGVVIGTSRDLETGEKVEIVDVCSAEVGRLRSVASWTIPTNNPLFRASVCRLLGNWDERMKCFEDASYMAGIFVSGVKVTLCASAVSFIRGHRAQWNETYSGRVSFRGEPERLRDHLMSLYIHQKNILSLLENAMVRDDAASEAAQRERLRIARLLLIEGLRFEADDLLSTLHRARSIRINIEEISLNTFIFLLGSKIGAHLHLKIHNLAFAIKSVIVNLMERVGL